VQIYNLFKFSQVLLVKQNLIFAEINLHPFKMKYNQLSIILLAFLVSYCDDSKKNKSEWFSFNNNSAKAVFVPSETLHLSTENTQNIKIDSTTYYFNDLKIGTTARNEPLDYKLEKEKFGYQNLKAVIYFEQDYAEIDKRIELVSEVETKLLSYEIVSTYPHDSKAYTQGIEFYEGVLYESTGNGEGAGTRTKGKSSVRKIDYKTGKILKINELDDVYFGEGLTFLHNEIYQLTWRNSVGFVYNPADLSLKRELKFTKKIEGWGLSNDGKYLLQTDGTEKIWQLNPSDFSVVDYINVYSGNRKIKSLNELEWVAGKIYANVYLQDSIAIINPETGAVEAIIDLSKLKTLVTQHPDLDVLNGIAYHQENNTFFVTGKNWDKLFEIKILNP
jgi:glutamine cyclotransferase